MYLLPHLSNFLLQETARFFGLLVFFLVLLKKGLL
jgi:hypothetical protein